MFLRTILSKIQRRERASCAYYPIYIYIYIYISLAYAHYPRKIHAPPYRVWDFGRDLIMANTEFYIEPLKPVLDIF